ncbi:hypothetical protein GGI12_003262 [Dipsacomyces acuminosporus]|nr:hypothetical protein GGI12_003262 [Dipsacomyces acuminosporus]
MYRAPSMMNGCQASLSLSNSAVKPSQQLGAVPENDGALQNEYVFLDASAIIAMYADDGPDISDQRYGEAPYKASLNGGSAAAINTVPNSPTPSSAKSSTTVGSTQDVELTKLNMGLSPAPSDVALNPSYYDKVTEMVVDRILKDCDLMDALTVPLPSTPNPQFPRAAVPSNPRLNVGGSDDSLSTSRSAFESKRQQNLDGNKAAGTGLEQSAPPSQHMPWFSQLDMEAHCKRYEDCLVQQKEMHEIHISSLKDEHAMNMRAQEQQARQDLAEAEVRFRQQFAEKEREFAQRLAAEQQAHMKSISLREEEANAQATQLDSEIAKMKAEHGELRTMLDEYVATSTVLLEQKDAETNALSAELGRLTLNHQQLREELSGSTARVAALSGERDETQERLELLVTENMRLEELNGALRGDVLVAEERNMKIRRHAEDTLSKANAEVGSLCEQLVESRKDVAALKTQAAKADARARSLQIQLDSLKRQNSELLELCERL